MAKNFEPDEIITKVRVQVHTAAVSDASTDSDIYIELFDWPAELAQLGSLMAYSAEIDSDDNDFEGGDTRWYSLPVSYFAGRIVNDILRVRVHKGDDGGSGWGLGWISVEVNSKELYTSPAMSLSPDVPTWLEDGQTWSALDFQRILFTEPKLENLGLPDADSGQKYDVTLTARGGRKPIEWTIFTSAGDAFTATPTLTLLNDEGTLATFSATTIATATVAKWTGSIQLTDADGRTGFESLKMRVINTLPAPTVKSFDPAFGWPSTTAESSSVVVTIKSKGEDFDSRKPDATKVGFTLAAGKTVPGTVLDVTSTELEVRVPVGAVPGPITVSTEFGTVSTGPFTAHPSGYRFVKGFSFTNRADDDDSSDGFPNTFDWLRYEQAFGLTEMWLVVIDQAVMPNPIATSFYLMTHDSIGSGCCHGFALTSLQMAKEIIPTSAFKHEGLAYPLDDALWEMTGPDRPSAGLSNWIQSRQLVTFSDEGLAYYLDRIDEVPNIDGALCHMDARPALIDVKLALAAGLSNPRMLAFSADCLPWRGHVVVPYGVEDAGKFERIRMYNPNAPALTGDIDDDGSFIKVHPGSGEWSHIWSDGEVWDGIYMFTIPFSEYGHQTDWSLPGLGSLTELGGLIMGSAGTDGDARITQVSDESGASLFDDKGVPHADHSLWPAGARPIPRMGVGGPTRPLVAITAPGPLTFTVRPRRASGQPAGQPPVSGLFAVARGPDRSVSVEDVAATLIVRFDASEDSIELAPQSGTASPIVRIGRRDPEGGESLSYAIRLRGLTAGTTARLQPTPDGRGVQLSADVAARQVDVEVTHNARNGRQRLLERGAVGIPAGAQARFSITEPTELEDPGALPLLVDLVADGATSRLEFGDGPIGPRVVAPFRVQAGAQIVVGGDGLAERDVPIDVSRSTGAGLRHRILGGPSRQDGDRLVVGLQRGTRPVRIVAEDSTGERSFARTVFVTVPQEGDRHIPASTLSAPDITVLPGSTGSVALETYFVELPAVGVHIDFSIRDRRSGVGVDRPALLDTGFHLSPMLAALDAQVSAKSSLDGMNLALTITWAANRPQNGEVDLGSLLVSVPPGVPLGSAFILRGKGTATTIRAGKPVERPLNALPVMIRSWGGPEPAALTIAGPATVAEGAEGALQAIVGTAVTASAGWWVERVSGLASVASSSGQPGVATLRGQRAGIVRVSVVVGTTLASKLIRIAPKVTPTRMGLGLIARSQGRRRVGAVSLAILPIV